MKLDGLGIPEHTMRVQVQESKDSPTYALYIIIHYTVLCHVINR